MADFLQVPVGRVIRVEQQRDAVIHPGYHHPLGEGDVVPGTATVAHGCQHCVAVGGQGAQGFQNAAAHLLWFRMEPAVQFHHWEPGAHPCLGRLHMEQKGRAG